jgi:hypothetical protein
MQKHLGKLAVLGLALSVVPALAQGAGPGANTAPVPGTPAPGMTAQDHARTAAATQAQEKAATILGSASLTGNISAYQAQMKSALAMSDQAQRDAAITRARQQLAQSSSKPLTSSTVAQLDSTLSIQGASPDLGASR